MLTTILFLICCLSIGINIGHLLSQYKLIRKNSPVAPMSSGQYENLSARLDAITMAMNGIWSAVQAQGNQTNAYTGPAYATMFTGPDYSGYSFTGYQQTQDQPSVEIGPSGANGPIGGSVPNNVPPPELLPAPEVDHIEEPRYL